MNTDRLPSRPANQIADAGCSTLGRSEIPAGRNQATRKGAGRKSPFRHVVTRWRSAAKRLARQGFRKSPPADSTRRPRPHSAAARLGLWAALLLLVGYAVCERIATTANADQFIRLESLGDDAVLVGRTDRQPGFVLLGRLPADRIHVDARLASSWIVGMRTHLFVRTPGHVARLRLRSPLVILVHEDGRIDPIAVPWTHEDFADLLHAADCGTECTRHAHRCGRPLEEIAHLLAAWPDDRVPQPVRTFLARSSTDCPRTRRTRRRLRQHQFPVEVANVSLRRFPGRRDRSRHTLSQRVDDALGVDRLAAVHAAIVRKRRQLEGSPPAASPGASALRRCRVK